MGYFYSFFTSPRLSSNRGRKTPDSGIGSSRPESPEDGDDSAEDASDGSEVDTKEIMDDFLKSLDDPSDDDDGVSESEASDWEDGKEDTTQVYKTKKKPLKAADRKSSAIKVRPDF